MYSYRNHTYNNGAGSSKVHSSVHSQVLVIMVEDTTIVLAPKEEATRLERIFNNVKTMDARDILGSSSTK